MTNTLLTTPHVYVQTSSLSDNKLQLSLSNDVRCHWFTARRTSKFDDYDSQIYGLYGYMKHSEAAWDIYG